MEEEYIIKKDGEVFIGPKVTYEETKPYIMPQNTKMANILDLQEFSNLPKTDIKIYAKGMDEAIEGDENYINEAIKCLQNFQNKNDLKRLLSTLLEKNKDFAYFQAIKKASTTNEDLLLSILIKNVLRKHYYQLLSSLTVEEIVSLEIAKVNNTSLADLFKVFNDNYSDMAKECGIYDLAIKIFADIIDVLFVQKNVHLCWENCKNATVTNCPRIRDGFRAQIANYPFITDGFQIKKNDKTKKFVITQCSKYEFAPNPTFNAEKIAELRNLQTQMMTNYFDTETLAEAVQLQENLMTRGQLIPYRIIEKDTLKIN